MFGEKINTAYGTCLAVGWLGLQASTSGRMGSILGQGNKIPHATQHDKKTIVLSELKI